MDAVIRINNTKECELEFEVNIQGISVDNPENAAQVRFVITNVYNGDLVFKCDHRADSTTKWFVKLPSLPLLSQKTDAHMFRIEVIIDGYYFEPATGNLILLRDPEVSVSNASKPKVSVQVTEPVVGKNEDNKDKVKPEEKKEEPKKTETKPEAKEEKKEEKVEERVAQAAGDIDGQTDPSTYRLVPEFPPDNDVEGDERMKGHARRMPEDEATNPFKVFHNTHMDEPEEEPEIANTIGSKVKKPEKQGFLFQRTDGKPVIEGVEPDAETKKKLKKKADAVRNALK